MKKIIRNFDCLKDWAVIVAFIVAAFFLVKTVIFLMWVADAAGIPM